LAVFHRSILYQWTHCYYLISAPLLLVKNRGDMGVFLEMPLSYRQFLLQNLVLKDGAYCWRIDLDIFYRMAPNIIPFPDVAQLEPFVGKTLFLAGEDSGYVKVDDVNTVFPEATLNVIPNAGHWLHVQQPGVFVERVEEFLL